MVQDLVDPGIVVADAEISRLYLQRLANGEERVEHQFLRHDAEKPSRIAIVGDDVVAEDASLAGIGVGQAREDRDQSGLAGAVGSEQAEELARFDAEVDAGKRLHGAETARDIDDLDRGRHMTDVRPAASLSGQNVESRSSR